ncbi:IclR family transcriptional regulator [Thorsellia anophelis]|uniref:HTH-type transcriptional repressor AllR n=1 Tax=Thorsellia anophelis DSM 18579 TaxID=1123402 RepID=A0A1I0CUM3_9GAMM|nr:IclR family transcriptional regulator [Thorsellia anophelis]SET23311.1 transcriptional regulator, IclR family [Thorsellia anophelis DSM 18579]
MKIDDDRSRAPAVDSAIKILELLSNSNHPLTLSEICSELKIPNSTGHRIMNELHSKNMVDYDATRVKAYCLGSQIFIMTSAVYNKQRLIPYFQPIGEQLSKETDLPVILTIPIGSNVVVIAKIDTNYSNLPLMHIGKTIPMHASAAGKAFLSMQSQRYIDNYFKQTILEACTNSTITHIQELKQSLITSAELGYAFAENEFLGNLYAVAAPVVNIKNEAIAAISIYQHESHNQIFHLHNLANTVIDAASQLSLLIQHTG